MKFLKFSIGNEFFGVDINKVDEVVEKTEITRIPNSPAEVEGVMDLRGETVTITNPKIIFDITGGQEDTVIVLGNQSNKGWVVNKVEEVMDIDENDIDSVLTNSESGISGIVKTENEFITIVDLIEIS